MSTTLDIRMIPIGDVQESPMNTRTHFSQAGLNELETSIRAVGILTPLLARHRKGGGFELASGHRRLRAAEAAGLIEIPLRVMQLTDLQLLEILTIDNLQREDVSPIEEAQGYQALQKADAKLYTVAAIAAKVGKTESYIYRRLKLLTLEEDLQDALAEGRLSMGHAEALCRLTAKQRKEAQDLALIWMESPLFDGEVDAIEHTAANLAPLHDLQRFMRQSTHFDPLGEDTRHFQPELVQELDEAPADSVNDTSRVIELSDDPMVRSRLGVGPNDPTPLPPSKWRQVKTAKDRCAFVVRGVITHGGPARVLDVCANKKCAKHFDQPKPASKSIASAAAKGAPAKPAGKPSWQIEEEKHEAARKEWAALKPHAKKALVEYLKTQKLDLRVVLERLIDEDLLDDYGVKLTKDTLPLCAALAVIGDPWSRWNFLEAVKPFKFNIGSVEQKLKAEQKKAAVPAKKAAKK